MRREVYTGCVTLSVWRRVVPFVFDSLVFLIVGMVLGLVLMRTFGKPSRARAAEREARPHRAHCRWPRGNAPLCQRLGDSDRLE